MSLGATKRTVDTQGMMRSVQKSRQYLARCLFEFPQLSVDLARHPPCTGLYLYAPPSLLGCKLCLHPSMQCLQGLASKTHLSNGDGLSATGQRKVKELLKRKSHSRGRAATTWGFQAWQTACARVGRAGSGSKADMDGQRSSCSQKTFCSQKWVSCVKR